MTEPLPDAVPVDAEERTATVAKANVAALAGVLPPLVVLAVVYGLVWGWTALGNGGLDLIEPLWRFLLIFLGGVLAHEALHAIAWRLAGAERGSVSLGFQLKTLTPYAHSNAPMSARAYRIGAVTPGLVLGAIPAVVGLALGAGAVFLFGLFFTLAAGGDALILWLLRGVSGDRLVKDHPSKPGCLVLGERAEDAVV